MSHKKRYLSVWALTSPQFVRHISCLRYILNWLWVTWRQLEARRVTLCLKSDFAQSRTALSSAPLKKACSKKIKLLAISLFLVWKSRVIAHWIAWCLEIDKLQFFSSSFFSTCHLANTRTNSQILVRDRTELFFHAKEHPASTLNHCCPGQHSAWLSAV